jgi:molecular chaperone GrpE
MNVNTSEKMNPDSPDYGLPEPTAEDLASETPAETVAPPGDALEGEDTPAARRYRDRWLRAEADFQNFRRRAQRDTEEARRFAEERVLLAMLEPLDDLERAIESARTSGAGEAWLQGVELVAQRMRDQLARHGVTEIGAVGARFDPEVHEALLEVDAPPGAEPGSVVQVARKGYARGGRALRPARVIVARSGS